MNTERKALLLSVGYGKGHHSAARALADELARRGWQPLIADICEAAHPRTFRLTQSFYRFCVHHAPRLWGAVYGYLDKADWARLIHRPRIRDCITYLSALLRREQPQLVVCTYPLFAFMLDYLAREEKQSVPYAVVVTDSQSISRPWLLSEAPLICLPDELSLAQVQAHYPHLLPRLEAPGFPVRADFMPGHRPLPMPEGEGLHIVYVAHAPTAQVCADVQAMLSSWPRMHLTLLAGERRARLADILPRSPRIDLCADDQDMAILLRQAHVYIGKAGAASVFEAYSAEVPMIVNYALPGQEQGNLQLLLHDGAGHSAASSSELIRSLHALLDDSSAGWQKACAAMRSAGRSGGAARTADALERRFFAHD